MLLSEISNKTKFLVKRMEPTMEWTWDCDSPTAIAKYRRLKNVKLVSINVHEFALIVQCLERNKNLQVLKFKDLKGFAELVVHSAVRLLKKGHPALWSLSFNNCNLSDIDVKTISKAATCNKSLKHLSFRSNCMSSQAALYVSVVLVENFNTLKSLTVAGGFYGCAVGFAIGDDGVDFIARALVGNKTLLHLVLQKCAITDVGAVVLSAVLASNERLENLCLKKNDIKNVGLQAIGNALSYNTALKSLDIRENDYNGVGLDTFFRSLRNNTSLHTLNLYESKPYEVEPMSRVYDAVEKNTTLQDLSLMHVDCPTDAITRIISKNTTLTRLCIYESIHDVEREEISIFSALKSNTTLMHLTISRGHFTHCQDGDIRFKLSFDELEKKRYRLRKWSSLKRLIKISDLVE